VVLGTVGPPETIRTTPNDPAPIFRPGLFPTVAMKCYVKPGGAAVVVESDLAFRGGRMELRGPSAGVHLFVVLRELFLVRVTLVICSSVGTLLDLELTEKIAGLARQIPTDSSPLKSATFTRMRSALFVKVVAKCDGVPTSFTSTWIVYDCNKK
jgi:hypothetical protein